MEEPVTFKDQQGHLVSAILSRPSQDSCAVAVLCHGFLSNKNSTTNKTLTRLLNEAGVATFRFDFFGQGQSEGLFEDITVSLAVGQADAAIALMRSTGYDTIGLVGSSFGGLAAILTAAQRQDVASLALKCPVVDFGEELRLEFGPDELARWQSTDTVPNFMGGADRVRLKFRLYEDCLRHIAYEPASRIVAPTLIVQGARDELVPLHQSQRLLEALRGRKRLEFLPEADHQFTRGEDFRAMTAAITEWLVRDLMPGRLPSDTME
ncbi:MAG TPA: alpha/beta fold hydrolase [Nitrospira sp.]|nr:alpha/beta fold hydrolase [Nitrospira sp.]